jgi:hypothetical protein
LISGLGDENELVAMDGDAGRQVELAVAVAFHPDDEERFAGSGINSNTIVTCELYCNMCFSI